MTISVSRNCYPAVAGNAANIDRANVVVLLVDHFKEADFQKIEEIISIYYRASRGDLIFLEQSCNSSPETLLEREKLLDSRRFHLFQGKTLEGWDHPLRDQWLDRFNQSPDVVAFRSAVRKVERFIQANQLIPSRHWLQEEEFSELPASFRTLARGARIIERNLNLYPELDRSDFFQNQDLFSAAFPDLPHKLLEYGKTTLAGLENLFIQQTFPFRQNSLVERLQMRLNPIISKGGKIFVIMGRNHGDPSVSPYPAEVQKVNKFLLDKSLYISL